MLVCLSEYKLMLLGLWYSQFLCSYPAGTRRPGDVPWRSPKGPNVRDLQGTFRGLTKKLVIKWKKCFLDAIVLVLHICYCFLLEKQICKSSKWGRPRDVYGTQFRDVPGTRWWDVLGKSPGRRSCMFFKFNWETYLTYFDRLLETLKWTVVAKNLIWGSVVKFLF